MQLALIVLKNEPLNIMNCYIFQTSDCYWQTIYQLSILALINTPTLKSVKSFIIFPLLAAILYAIKLIRNHLI